VYVVVASPARYRPGDKREEEMVEVLLEATTIGDSVDVQIRTHPGRTDHQIGTVIVATLFLMLIDQCEKPYSKYVSRQQAHMIIEALSAIRDWRPATEASIAELDQEATDAFGKDAIFDHGVRLGAAGA
jgi:hypothetical protein